MKIYFAGAVRAGRDSALVYKEIIEYLKKYGQVLTEHLGNEDLTDQGENLPDIEIFRRDEKWLMECDVVVAEVTVPALGVGYEIGRAVENKKRVLCLYRPIEGKKLSVMINGCPEIEKAEYKDISEVEKILDNFFNF